MSSRSRGFAVQGWGTALPTHVMTQTEAADLAREVCCRDEQQAGLLKVLYRRSGVKTRHTVVPHRQALDYLEPNVEGQPASRGPTTGQRMALYRALAPDLAIRASRQALDESKLSAAAITHLVSVSCTGFAAPGVDTALIEGLDLRPTIERTHVGYMGCHGALNGLRVARALALSDPRAIVCVCAVELCSLHYEFGWHPERIVGNALFADGAAALVGRASDGGDELLRGSQQLGWSLAASGSCIFPNSQEAICWQIGDYGFEMVLSPAVPGLIRERLRDWLAAWLAQQGLRMDEVGTWAVHPGGPRILSAVQEALQLDDDALAVSREVLSECGNMSSPTVVFILDRLRQRNARLPCVALGFGPGLVAEAALFV